MSAGGKVSALAVTNPLTGTVTQAQGAGAIALPAEIKGNLAALVNAAKARAKLGAIEKEWTVGEGFACVVSGRGADAGPWTKVILHKVDADGNVGAAQERLCPTVLWNEIVKGLTQGKNTFYVEYLGKKAASSGARSYHNFGVEILGSGKSVAVVAAEDAE